MTQPVIAYVALGSNLDEPLEQVRQALQALAQFPATTILAQSSLYRTAPIGPQDQDDYVNAVVKLQTALSPDALLSELMALEQRHARTRVQRWGARTLDLDVLFYGDKIINETHLQVPHPRLTERAFVLVPLLEIAPDKRLPDGAALVDFLENCADQAIHRLEEVI